MPLNWSLEKCVNKDELLNKDWQLTNIMIHLTMLVGIGDISEANHELWYKRLAVVQLMKGPFLHTAGDGKTAGHPYLITLKDVRDRIGLRTNVGTISQAKFLAAVKRWAVEVGDDALRISKAAEEHAKIQA